MLIGLLFLSHSYLIVSGETMRIASMAMSSVWLIFWCGYFAVATLVPAGLYRAANTGVPAATFA